MGASGKATVYAIRGAAPTGGMLFVSASDCARPVLGYTDNDIASLDDLPEQFGAWLRMMSEQIDGAETSDETTTGGAKCLQLEPPFAETTAITPLCKTQWGQNAPYINCFMPTKDNVECMPGDKAVAMAQVMRVHRWPEENGVGTVHNTPVSDDMGYMLDEDVCDNLAASDYIFYWDLMLNAWTSTTKNPNQSRDMKQVSCLLRAAGMASATAYGVNKSTATIGAAVNALVTNFGYDQGVKLYYLDYYSLDFIKRRIYDNLSNGQPCIMNTWCVFNNVESNHAYVIDGYKVDENGQDVWHCNFGNAPSSKQIDGYYALDALKYYAATKYGSTFVRSVVVDIKKPDGTAASRMSPANAIFNYDTIFDTAPKAQDDAFAVDVDNDKWMVMRYSDIHVTPNYRDLEWNELPNSVGYGAICEDKFGNKVWLDAYGSKDGAQPLSVTMANDATSTANAEKWSDLSSLHDGVYCIYPGQHTPGEGDYRRVANMYNRPQCVVAEVEGDDIAYSFPQNEVFNATQLELYNPKLSANGDSVEYIMRFRATYDIAEQTAASDAQPVMTTATDNKLFTQVALGIFDMQGDNLTMVATGPLMPVVLAEGSENSLRRFPNYKMPVTTETKDSYRIVLYNQAGVMLSEPEHFVVKTGIDCIANDDKAEGSVAHYYNLQGIEVSEPLTPGIYVKRQGTKAGKTVVR